MSPFVAGWKGGDTNHRSEPKIPAARFLSKMGTKLLCTFCTNVPLYVVGVYMASPNPLETILLSIILEHEKMIGEILGKLKEKKGEKELNQNKMEKS